MINQEIYDALKQHVTGLFDLYDDFRMEQDFKLVVGGCVDTAQVTDKSVRSGYNDEYVPQYFVFRVGGKFYKLEGYKDSYGGLEWDNHLTQVERKEKVVYLYE
jgi:hypothetical protein